MLEFGCNVSLGIRDTYCINSVLIQFLKLCRCWTHCESDCVAICILTSYLVREDLVMEKEEGHPGEEEEDCGGDQVSSPGQSRVIIVSCYSKGIFTLKHCQSLLEQPLLFHCFHQQKTFFSVS